jgi:hypothetical protein
MKVNFGDNFFKSLDKLYRYEAWHNRMWRAITGDLWEFFKNIWRFRTELWEHRWWDYRFTLITLKRSLIIMEKGMHNGLEVHETRGKKIEKMQRAIKILENITNDCYIEMAEVELGELFHREWEWEETGETTDNPFGEKDEKLYRLIDNDTPEEKEHNSKVFARSRELEEAEWKELWEIMQGQDYDKFKKAKDWNEQFDGSGLRSWWD